MEAHAVRAVVGIVIALAATPNRQASAQRGPLDVRRVSQQSQSDRPDAIVDRAVSDFLAGRVTESAAEFDTVARLVPDQAAELWQRGIALYYAGRYADCRAQFEAHRRVNPDDVENAAWHFLCVARAESVERARAALLPVGPDRRAPMTQIYEMFRGTLRPDDVLAAAGATPSSLFYAQLYVGLYYEATGDSARALEHVTLAAADRFASVGGYMHDVAKVHLMLRVSGTGR